MSDTKHHLGRRIALAFGTGATVLVCGVAYLNWDALWVDGWNPRSSMPTARGSLTAARVLNRIHVIGGSVDYSGTKMLPVHEAYDPRSNTWIPKAAVPDSNVWGARCEVLSGKIYLFGGWYSGSRLTRIYDPKTDSWTDGAEIPCEFRYGHATATARGRIYLFGGEPTAKVCVYDPKPDRWTIAAAAAPVRATGLAAEGIGEKIYIVGSGSTLHIYDPAEDTWSVGAPLPSPVHAASTAVSRHKLFVIGGSSRGMATSSVTGTAFAYDPRRDRWRTLENMPTPRYWSAAAAYSGGVHVFGGFRAGNDAVNTHERID
ncbi:MAG: kelch repeat-containing protein [Planctomycetota bacterium]